MSYRPSWLKTDIEKDNSNTWWNYEGWKEGSNRVDLSPVAPVKPVQARRNRNMLPATSGMEDMGPSLLPIKKWDEMSWIDKIKAGIQAHKTGNYDYAPIADIQKQKIESQANSKAGSAVAGFQNALSLGSFDWAARKQQEMIKDLNIDLPQGKNVFKASSEANPTAYEAGKIAGYVAPSVLGAGVVKPVVSKIASPLLKQVAEGAAVASAMTGVEDTFQGKSLKETGLDMLKNAAGGAVLDVGLYGLGKAVKLPKYMNELKIKAVNDKLGNELVNAEKVKLTNPVMFKNARVKTLPSLLPEQMNAAVKESAATTHLDVDNIRAQAESIRKAALVKQQSLNSIMDGVNKELGLQGFGGEAKSVDSIVNKVMRKNNSDYTVNSMKDHARGVIYINDYSEVPKVLEALSKRAKLNGEEFITEPLNNLGYRAVHLSTDLGDGINGEIQLHTRESWGIKEVTDGIYGRWRDKDLAKLTPEELKEYNDDIIKSQKLWNGFWDNQPLETKRLAASSVNGLASMSDPAVPLKGTHEPFSNTSGSLPSANGEVSTTLPSSNKLNLDNIESPPTNILQQNKVDFNNVPNDSLRQFKVIGNVKDKLKETIDSLLENSGGWKDKKIPLQYKRETLGRNNIDIAGAEDGARLNEFLIDPMQKNEATRIKFLNFVRDKVKNLKLTAKESEAVQKFGEGKYVLQEGKDASTGKPKNVEYTYNLDNLKADFPDSWQKIVKAVDVFRSIYDETIDMANEVLVSNGYKPIKKLDNYFPHFTKDDPLMKALGINFDVTELSTEINGRTHRFKPGKNWFANFLHREGELTDFGAVEGIDKYIEGISKVIYHTDDIKRLREFNKAIRTKYAGDTIKEGIEQVLKSNVTDMQKDVLLGELFGRDKMQLSNYVADLDEFTNNLAGKKDIADRASESNWGRQIFNVSNSVSSRVAKNMVAVNPGSWLTNFVPLTQSLATTDKGTFLKAMKDTIASLVQDDGFKSNSSFLTRREGSDILGGTNYTLNEILGSKGGFKEKRGMVFNNAGNMISKTGDVLSAPMGWIDNFTSSVITRAKYMEGIKKGLDEKSAMKQADEWAAKIMGDRSLGAQPTLFNQKKLLTKLATQFQLEVNNQMSFLLKDLPREYFKGGVNSKNIARLTSAVGQMAVYGFLYNEIYSELTGRRPAVDPIGAALQFKEDLNNPELKDSDAVTNLAESAVGQLPFAGTFMGGGRLPISAAAPDLPRIWNAASQASTGEMDKLQAAKEIGKSLENTAYYMLPPFGGGQARKTIGAVKALKQGGVYSENGSQLKYPIEDSNSNKIKSLLFGVSSLKETGDYYDNNRKPLSVKQTKLLKAVSGQEKPTKEIEKQIWEDRLKDKTPKEIYNKFLDDRAVNKERNDINKLIEDKGLSKEQKNVIKGNVSYYVNMKDVSAKEKAEKLRLIGESLRALEK